MRAFTKVYITKKGEFSARGGHPWVFDEEIIRMEGTYKNGDLVDVMSSKDKYIGTGFINDNSKIRVRISLAILMTNLTRNFLPDVFVMRLNIEKLLCRGQILNVAV